jgi:hypothetical protein
MRALVSSLARWLREHWPVVLIFGAGYTAFMIYAYPGYMSIDSAVHLLEGRNGHYSDWHPPMIAWEWHIVDWVIKGPLGMLLIQSIALLAGLYRWLRRAYQPTAAAALSVAIFLFPPVFAPMAVVWKDCHMAAYLLLGTSLVLSQRRPVKIAGLLLLLLASGMRDNSPSTTLPFLVLAFTWRPAPRPVVRVVVAVAIWIVISAAAIGFNKGMTDQRMYAWHTAVATHDIVGVLKFSHTNYSDAELEEILAGTPIMVHENIQRTARWTYTPISWWSMVNGDRRMFDWPTTEAQRTALARAWKQLVSDNPRSYLYHRWRVFREVLGITAHPLTSPMWNGQPSDDYVKPLHIEYTPNQIQIEIGDALIWLATQTKLFRPYLYFFLALLFVPLAWRQRDVLALLASGLVYEFSFFPFGGGDVRYSHWMTITALVAGLILFRRRYGERPPAPAS